MIARFDVTIQAQGVTCYDNKNNNLDSCDSAADGIHQIGLYSKDAGLLGVCP